MSGLGHVARARGAETAVRITSRSTSDSESLHGTQAKIYQSK